MDIKWSSRAIKRVKYYDDWYFNYANINTSLDFVNEVDEAIKIIVNNPYIAKVSKYNSKVRELVVKKYPFIIFYEVKNNDTIYIVNLLHQTQNY